MIIGLAGRMRSGKTELSKICETYGYERLYFALPLKQLISKLIDKTIDEVNELKNIESEYILSDNKIKLLSDETNIPLNIINQTIKNKIFHTTREMLQFIGTDIIRNFNKDWHVNKIQEMIDTNKNYIIDDVRFPNEKQMIENNGGILFFIIRPNLENISNHESEISLKWQNFDNIIINDVSLEQLKFKWETFIKNGFVNSLLKRAQLLNKIQTDETIRQTFMKTTKETLSMFDMLFINKCEFTYNPKFIEKSNEIKNIEIFNNCIYRVYYNNGNVEIITNPLMIEDLKFYET